MKGFVLSFLFLSTTFAGISQTFTGSGGTIPDDGNPVTFALEIGTLNPQTIDTVFGLESVNINLTHPYDADLRIKLIAPDGSTIMLADGNGGDGDNYLGTYFTDDATQSVYAGAAPFTGNFKPIERMGYINNGQPGNGVWQLYILDTYAWADAGYLLNWSITFSNNPGTPFPFSNSNLPLILISTNGQEIPDEPKIAADFTVIDNGYGGTNHLTDVPAYTGTIGIEIRGSSSQMFPKKNYGFETWDAQYNSIDTSLLGMPAESDWILNASFTDKTLMRNTLGYQTWMNLGHYATRYRYVEVFINNRYKGVYIFSEKIKRDKDRVNIAKLTNTMNTGDKVTGGYIFKIDRGEGWTSRFPAPANPSLNIYFQYEYPKLEDITDPQKQYIQAYVDTFEVMLNSPVFADPEIGWRKYAIEETFVDYFLENEFSKNVDGLRLSTFIQKERNSMGGKLRMGPVWDFDLAWHNANYCEGDLYTGWSYQFPCTDDWFQVPFWWERLLQDTVYANNISCRWSNLRSTYLSQSNIFAYIDSTAAMLQQAQQRNFEAWPIIGIYVWPNPWPYPTSYAGEIASLKNWITHRLAWLDDNMPGICYSVGIQEKPDNAVLLSPNPAGGSTKITGLQDGERINTLHMFDVAGKQLTGYTLLPGNTLDVSALKQGLYFMRIVTDQHEYNLKMIKK